MRKTRLSRRTRLAHLLAGIVIAAVGDSLLPAELAGAAQPKALFDLAGTLERFPADARAALGDKLVPLPSALDDEQKGTGGTGIVVPETRQLVQVYFSTGFTSPQLWALTVRDLDTLKLLATVPLAALERDTIYRYGGSWSHAVDAQGKRIFFLGQNNRLVYEVSLVTFAVKTHAMPSSAGPNVSGGIIPGGMTYDPYADDLLFLFGGPPANSAGAVLTLMYTLDVSGPGATQASPSAVSGFYYVRTCGGPLSTVDAGGETYGWQILVRKEYLYVPCHRAGHTAAIVRMTRPRALTATPSTTQPVHSEDIVAGPVYAETVLADQNGGRLFVATTLREVWVFDAGTMSFIGIVAAGPENTRRPTSYGLDPLTGRFFFQSPLSGLGVAEGRFFPLPQARTTARFADGQEGILSDAQNDRVFVVEGKDQIKDLSYRIYKVDHAPTPPPPPNPDRNTVDQAEKEGVTEARYFSSGSGYGMRVLLAKGFSTVTPAPNVGVITPTAQAIDKHVNSKCGYTDRELVAGRVQKAEYDTGSAAAVAIALDVDGATKQDVDKPSRCDVTVRDTSSTRFAGIFATEPFASHEKKTQADDETTQQQESRWNRRPATCASSDETGRTEGVGKEDDFGPSKVACPVPGGTLVAEATGRLQGGIAVDLAWTKTVIERGSWGVRSTVESVAKGIDIANGAIKISEIRSTATSTSNGRPQKSPMSTHTISARGVQVNGQSVCGDSCDLTALVDTLNVAAAGKAAFRAGSGASSGRDEDLLRGSARGALTAVQKSAARQASDQALVGDFTTEVPGLEVTVFNDNTQWGRARQLYQFAGVSTAATYNIVMSPTGAAFTDDEDFVNDIGVAGGDGSTPYDGILAALEHRQSGGGAGGVTGLLPTSTIDDGSGEGLPAPLRALARGIRLFFSNPRQSLLLLTAWALLSLPGMLARRRRLLDDVHAG